jgi:hypothetical protein
MFPWGTWSMELRDHGGFPAWRTPVFILATVTGQWWSTSGGAAAAPTCGIDLACGVDEFKLLSERVGAALNDGGKFQPGCLKKARHRHALLGGEVVPCIVSLTAQVGVECSSVIIHGVGSSRLGSA